MFGPFGDLPIAEILDDLEDFRPTRKRPLVHSLVLIHRHDEVKQFAADFALLGCPANLAAPPTRSATSVHSVTALAAGSPLLALSSSSVRSIMRFSHAVRIGSCGLWLKRAGDSQLVIGAAFAGRWHNEWRRSLVRLARSHYAVDVVRPSHTRKRGPILAAHRLEERPVPAHQAVTPTLRRAGLSESVVIVEVIVIVIVVIGKRIVIIIRVVVKIVVVPIVVIAIVIQRVVTRGVRDRHLEMDDHFAGLLM